jgi:hypothetical protein
MELVFLPFECDTDDGNHPPKPWKGNVIRLCWSRMFQCYCACNHKNVIDEELEEILQ